MTEDALIIRRALATLPNAILTQDGWSDNPVRTRAEETLAAILAELECWKRRAERAEGELCYLGKLGLD